ncbi:MAG: hypothetical protein WC756_04990 [Taibaiella sp.]|jgi:hypothetical protein
MLTENHITDLLEKYFIDHRCQILSKLTTKQKGVDLVVKDSHGQIVYIEVKGETSADEKSNKFGQYFSKTQIWTHGSVALMKTLQLMSLPENQNIKFALGLPKNHEPMFSKIKVALDKLGITVYLVSNENISIL